MIWTLAYLNSQYYFLVIILSILGRTLGCLINDILDMEFDRAVKRTKNRPLASGDITKREALIWFCIVGLLVLAIMIFYALHTFYLCMIIFSMILAYPFMKRITYLPQLWLGIVFAMGVFFVTSYSQNLFSVNIILIFLLAVFWVVSFDIVYAMQDLECDIKIGVKSIPVLFKQNSIYITLCLNILVLILFYWITFSPVHNTLLILMFLDFAYQHWLFLKKDFKRIFEGNVRIGIIIYIGFLAGA
jgi:4-hydroxybenzoate polyprenyltransferase